MSETPTGREGRAPPAAASSADAAPTNPSDTAAEIRRLAAEAWGLVDAGRPVEARAMVGRLVALGGGADGAARGDLDHLLGLAHHQLGEIEAAIARLAAAARALPARAGAHNDLGCACFAAGRADEARAAFERAVAADPNFAEAHFNLGNLHQMDGRLDAAAAAYGATLAAKPKRFEAHYNLGLVRHAQARFDEALAALDAALALDPYYADAHCARGLALQALGRDEEAVAAYRKALRQEPDHGAAAANLAALGESAEPEPDPDRPKIAAVEAARAALRETPGAGEAHLALGRALAEAGDARGALTPLRRAVDLMPGDARAIAALGEATALAGDRAATMARLEALAAREPHSGSAYHNQAVLHFYDGEMDAGLARLDLALSREPDNARFRFTRGSVLLRMGRLEEGFREFEARHGFGPAARTPRPADRAPAWDGSPLPDGRLVVRAEWGLGDVLFFSRFIPLLKARVGTVYFDVYPKIAHLYRGMPGVDRVFTEDEPRPAHDRDVGVVSLPHLLGTTMATIPTGLDFLTVDERRVAEFAGRLAGRGGLRVGFCWRSSIDYTHGLGASGRSLRLDYLADLVRRPGIAPVCLLRQEDVAEEIAAAGLDGAFVDFGRPLDDGDDAFVDTAAIIRNLDLVISCDTSIAHLAATLGCPVWLFVPRAGEWRWFLDRDDSPWYPGMRLFRQGRQNIWHDVVGEIGRALDTRLAAGG